MNKYGVVIEESSDKTAGDKSKCPWCGRDLVKNTNVPTCPDHGTKPFEKQGK